jgi:chitin synthase
MAPFISCLPIQAPNALYTAIEVIRAFTHCCTPVNPSFPRYSSLAAKFEVNIGLGQILNASLALSSSGIDTERGLLNVPGESGHRAFDVFYYVLSSLTPGQRQAVNAGPPSSYRLLRRSGTFSPPSYVPTADDAAAAEAFKENLKAIGIQGPSHSALMMALISLLKFGETLDMMIDEEELDTICDEVETILHVQEGSIRRNFDTITERGIVISGLYEALVDYVIQCANETMREELIQSRALAGAPPIDEEEDSVNITVINIPGQDLGKAIAMRTVFDDAIGINSEMKEDGVPVVSVGSSVLREMQSAIAACEPDLNIMTGAAGSRWHEDRDRREGVLEKLLRVCDDDSFIRGVLQPEEGSGIVLGKSGRFNLSDTVDSSRVWFQLNLHPTDDDPATLNGHPLPWSAGTISRQLRAWRLPEWSNRRNRALDYTVDFDLLEFYTRYCRLGCQEGKEGIQFWLAERGWTNGEVFAGHQRVWMREAAWWEAESMIEALPPAEGMLAGGATPLETGYSVQTPPTGSGFFGPGDGSRDNLLQHHQSTYTLGQKSHMTLAPSVMGTARNLSSGDYGLGRKGDTYKGEVTYEGEIDAELADGKVVVEQKISNLRRIWVAFIWAVTFWIPSPLLRYIGNMKRPDVRFAWREKLVLVTGILLLNAFIVFFIIAFGRLLCPNFDKAWSPKEVSFHQGNNDYYVSHGGKVYDLSKFWKTQHSDTNIKTTTDNMQPFGGTNVDELIRPPLSIACPHLTGNDRLKLTPNNTVSDPSAIHDSGPFFQPTQSSKLYKIDWYTSVFLPRMKEMYKGDLVYSSSTIKSQGTDNNRMWFTLGNNLYDMTDYFYNVDLYAGDNKYVFFPSKITAAVQQNPGGDLTSAFSTLAESNSTMVAASQQCLDNYFYAGRVDFRNSVKCQVTNYLLLAFTIILCSVILVKFLAALQLGSKRRPAPQDKFVICQVPAYTEGEDQLRKGLDSLTALAYDNKRKLICVICDGMIVGGGNDRPTPKIVLDVLGVDPKIDPPALPFKSVGAGSEQLNYGKVYSGLYEYEGNVVPYLVVVKVGRESEQGKSKPGNRGKRDSQILLMSFLNRVHHRSPMSPLELEMFHQINNVIGVDPELYEYLFMVDADTSVKEDSLNRLVAACANDKKIAGICGETSLENEERSWWTMIQVYEYYISHHLAKAFESLFGSVTCLPGW